MRHTRRQRFFPGKLQKLELENNNTDFTEAAKILLEPSLDAAQDTHLYTSAALAKTYVNLINIANRLQNSYITLKTTESKEKEKLTSLWKATDASLTSYFNHWYNLAEQAQDDTLVISIGGQGVRQQYDPFGKWLPRPKSRS